MACKVVSVEDEPEIAELLRIVLSSPYIDVYCSDNGPDGIELIRSVKPDLVVLDIMLPGMNGWAIYDAIRADDGLKNTPVVMLSVLREEPGRRQASVGSPIDLYVTKPFDTARLRSDIERMLGRKGLWPATKPLIKSTPSEELPSEKPAAEPTLSDNGSHEGKPAPDQTQSAPPLAAVAAEPAGQSISAQAETKEQAVITQEKPPDPAASEPLKLEAQPAIAPEKSPELAAAPPVQVTASVPGDTPDSPPKPEPPGQTQPVPTSEPASPTEAPAVSNESDPAPDSSAQNS